MSKTTTTALADVAGAGASVDEVQEALATVARAFVQPRVHERLMRAAGVRLDRGGAALLYKLRLHGDALRVTALADLLGIDAPTVTRKVQQLERDGLVTRRPDADDGRAWRIHLTAPGRRSIERVLRARQEWLAGIFTDWRPADIAAFARLLSRFADELTTDLDEHRDH